MTMSLPLLLSMLLLLCPVSHALFIPFQFQRQSANYARLSEWNEVIIEITKLSHLTLYTQCWITLALYYMTPILLFIAKSLSIGVFIMYHTFVMIDPMSLSYHSTELTKDVTGLIPGKNVGVWAVLQLQHSVFPFYLFLTYPNIGGIWAVFATFVVVAFYIGWSLFCWHVHGIPAYPFLAKLRNDGNEVRFYELVLILSVALCCIISRLWVELLMFSLGVVTSCGPNYIHEIMIEYVS